MEIKMNFAELYGTIDTAVLFLEAIAANLRKFLDSMKDALPRCKNCGKVMDQSVCPYCGAVQK